MLDCKFKALLVLFFEKKPFIGNQVGIALRFIVVK